MIDLILFAGRIVLVVVLYIFLIAVMKTGVGLVRGQRRDSATGRSMLRVPRIRDRRQTVRSWAARPAPTSASTSPSCPRATRASPCRAPRSIEDLNSLNGTLVNGRQLVEPATLREGDEVQIGDVVMKVNRR